MQSGFELAGHSFTRDSPGDPVHERRRCATEDRGGAGDFERDLKSVVAARDRETERNAAGKDFAGMIEPDFGPVRRGAIVAPDWNNCGVRKADREDQARRITAQGNHLTTFKRHERTSGL